MKDGRPLGNLADRFHAVGLQAEQAHAGDPDGHRDQRRRRSREEALESDQQDDHDDPDSQGRQRRVGNGLNDGQQIVEERALGEMDAQQLRDLVQHDDEPDPRLEADQHRFGDEVGDEAQPQERSQHEDGSHQQRQRRRSAHQGRRIAIRGDLAELGRRQDGERRGGAHAERPRRPEHCVDHHRHQRRVEPHLHRQPGDRGVGHRLRNHDRGRDQAGDQVPPQPLLLITEQPIQYREGAVALAVS